MAPPLQGYTLGQRQKFYNELVKKEMENNTSDIPKINFDDDDIDNMIRIDIACKRRKVEYILNVFKCEDMLYVSKAINKSTWLITEPQYADIVNPKYLHSELFPHMNAKAITKLMLHIRRHLKDEVRVKAFYNYVNEKSPKAALHWLGNCSLNFMEKIVASRGDEIPLKLLKRYCKKAISILHVFLKYHRCTDICGHNIVSDTLNALAYFLKNKNTAEEFVNIVQCCEDKYTYFDVHLNKKYTHILMKTCPEKIKENFVVFHKHIDLPTFVKYVRTDEIAPFLLNTTARGNWEGWEGWKSFDTLAPFLERMRREEVLGFLSALYKVEYVDNSKETGKSNVEAFFYALENGRYWYNSYRYVYRWYRFVPFDIAFRDIKRLIFAESAPEIRHYLLITLLNCASCDVQHLKTVLQYYHDKHINEPYLHKRTFIESLLSQHQTFRFDDTMWTILNALFHSSEVYIESGNVVQASLISIIVRDVLHDRPVYEVVEEKFEIETLKNIKSKLSLDEQKKVFSYLHTLLIKRLDRQSTDSETGMRKAIELLKTYWALINDWDRVESHHGLVISKIIEVCDVNKTSSWVQEMKKTSCRRKRRLKTPVRDLKKPQSSIDIASIYKMVKSFRKLLFERSLVFHANEDVLLNALKHDPGLLLRCKTEIDFLRSNDDVSLRRFLSKLRIYWPDTLAIEWTETNTLSLNKLSGHRALVRGILTLLSYDKALDFIKMYTPSENKIQWGESDQIELSIQKHIAKNMHIARPQLPAEVVLWYAKGDYLQHALLSLCTMYYNLRSSDIRKYIALMLSAPVSLQKHGIRLAFVKYNTNEKIEVAGKIWKKTKNTSIRAILFTSIFDLLCKENKIMMIKAIWSLLSSLIDDLNDEENKVIYKTLGRVSDVPPSVVGDFYQKSYLFLQSLPPQLDVHVILENVVHNAEKFIEHLDPKFVENLLGTMLDRGNPRYYIFDIGMYSKILAAYLLCSKDLNIQMQKYYNLIQPRIDKYVTDWVNRLNSNDLTSSGWIHILLGHICSKIPHYVFEKDMTMPVEILRNIMDAILKGPVCVEEHYVEIRRWQLTVRYVEALDEMKKSHEEPSWKCIRTASIHHLASICHDIITKDQHTFYPSIYLLFKDALTTFLNDFQIRDIDLLKVLYEMLQRNDCQTIYMLVLEIVPDGQGKDFIHWKNKIKKQINFHPSKEVRMHYFRRFRSKYDEDVEDDDEIEGSDSSNTTVTCSEDDQNVTTIRKPRNTNNNPFSFFYRCNII